MALTLTRRAAVAAALSAAGPSGVSGEALARGLGISRVAVGKHVAALGSLGYLIEPVPRVGYRLVSAPDACLPEEVAPRLRDPLWTTCEGGPEAVSTNDDAKRLARAGAEEGTLVVAARQTGGRGRLGRTWESPAGGGYASAVLRPNVSPAQAAPLALAVSLGVARGLDAFGLSAGVKWPNDVMLEGGKLAGILLEMAAEADTVEWLVAGIGINVAAPAAPDAAWVRRHAPEARVAEVVASALDGVAAAYREFVSGGFGALAEEYRARLTLTGVEVAVRDGVGAVVASGVAETVDDDGALVVRGPDGPRTVVAGEVTLR